MTESLHEHLCVNPNLWSVLFIRLNRFPPDLSHAMLLYSPSLLHLQVETVLDQDVIDAWLLTLGALDFLGPYFVRRSPILTNRCNVS